MMKIHTNLLITTILFFFFALSISAQEGKSNIAESTDEAIEGGVETLDKLKKRAKQEGLENKPKDAEGNNNIDNKAEFQEEFQSKSIKNLERQFLRKPYSSRGKRDPFKAFVRAPRETQKAPVTESTPPIKRYSLNQYRIVGIINYANSPKAMVVDPEQNTYYLGIDDEIGNKNGKIVEVRNNGLLVQEKRFFEDVFGNSKVEVKKSVLAFVEEEE